MFCKIIKETLHLRLPHTFRLLICSSTSNWNKFSFASQIANLWTSSMRAPISMNFHYSIYLYFTIFHNFSKLISKNMILKYAEDLSSRTPTLLHNIHKETIHLNDIQIIQNPSRIPSSPIIFVYVKILKQNSSLILLRYRTLRNSLRSSTSRVTLGTATHGTLRTVLVSKIEHHRSEKGCCRV